ncbi:MAG: PPC domain-containing protein [Chloroflexota bacterium]
MRKIILLAALIALLTVPLAVGAQTAPENINYGDTVNGTLETGHLSAQYVFFGNRGDVITAALDSKQFDGFLTLLDPGLNEVATDDDSGGSSNPSIMGYALATTGDFTIVVDSYNRLQTGDFSLTLTGTIAPPEATQAPESTAGAGSDTVVFKQDIAFGQTITTSITSDISAYSFHFDGKAGQHVTIPLTSSDFDAYLQLQDSGGKLLIDDDDSAGNLNAIIQDFTLPADGTYSILAGSYGGGVDGAFTLSLVEAGSSITPPDATGTPTPQATPTLRPTPGTAATLPANTDVTPINIGDTVNDTVGTFDGSRVYSFTGQAGQSVTITATSDAFDTYVQLFDADGKILAEDDDSAGDLNAKIQDFALPANGIYSISVGSFSGGASGAFTLSITAQGVIAQPTVTSGTPAPTGTPGPESTAIFTTSPAAINIGDTINGTLPEDTRSAIYTFTGSAGQSVTITLSSSDFDSYLSLKNSSGEEIAYDDDSAGNLNAKIQDFTLPDDGTYTIQATSFGSFVTGSFTLALEGGAGAQPTPEATTIASNGGAINLNAQVSGELAQDGSNASYTFEGSAGQVVTITLESNDFDAYLALQGPDGTEIASDDDGAGSLNARIADFSLPDDGTYTVVVTGANNFSTGKFTLSTATSAIEATATPGPIVPGSISIGQTLDSTLDQAPNTHTFAGKAGQVISIEVDSSDFDAYVQLKDANGIELASDDDSAGNLNALIENFTLPTDATYAIVVSSFDNTASGDYKLTVSEGSGTTVTPVPPTNVPAGSEIAIGDTVNGTLSGGSLTASYTFQGEAGQVVTITATSEDFDSYLRLKDSSGNELATDDDSAGNLDSRIAFYALPSTDTYTIVVESFDSAGGSYTLSLSEAEIQSIEYSQSINGALSAGQATAGYRFSGEAGDVITITMRSSAFDSYLSLSQAGDSSYALITDDDSAGGSDARIGPYTLPTSGDYIITASSYDATVTGAYTLELDRAVLSPIEFDQPVTVDITADNATQYFSFEGKTGDVINVEADSGGSVDTSLTLTGPDSYQVTSDDDSGKDFDPEISHLVLSSDGTYTIGLSAYSAGDNGTVKLTLTRAPLRSLDDGPQDVRLNEKITQDVLTFTGAAGQSYRLWVEVRGSVGSPNLTITQNGTSVATGSASTSSALMVEFTVPDDGAVTVQITDYSYAKVVMNVRVEAVGE